ncbi:MAG: electron transport complex subunit RsxC, partial [Pseudomonadales bacterium]|nr:electron transport complex subunit RsxC [Pseudomonadales bacterium]
MLGLGKRGVKFGAIKPPPHKLESLRSRIMPTPLPERLVLSLQQHQGDASIPCVEVGDKVLKFQTIAIANSESSLNLHAPTSGKILSVEQSQSHSGNAAPEPCIVLECDGEDNPLEVSAIEDYRALEHDSLLQRIEDAGICGMGGAGFPTALKLRHGIARNIDQLVINAAECEPYISCDEALLRERAKEVIQGAEILQAACLASSCQLIIESNMNEAIDALRSEITGSSVQLKIVAPSYPAGDESQIVFAATGRETPSSGLPIDVGVVVLNAGTAAACMHGVSRGLPCISRVVTLTGTPLRTPKNFDVPIGTPISHLLTLCGIDKQSHQGTLAGGSLMGEPVHDLDSPIKKTNNCVVAMSTQEFPTQEPVLPCIRCGYCADACPAHLLPQQLLVFSKQQAVETLEDHGLFDCIECGACAYVCPSKIPLVQYYRSSKELML